MERTRALHEFLVDGAAGCRDEAKRRLQLWYFIWELPDAVRAVAWVSLVGSFLCAVAPLYWPLCWLNGGLGDSIILVAICGTVGLFFSAVGIAGERLRHPGYLHAFFGYLLARMLANTGVFILDRYNLEQCEMYENPLTNRIYPNLTLHRLANQDADLLMGCHGARVFITARWIVDVFVSLYTLWCVHSRYDSLHSHLLGLDVFEDPVDVFARWRDQQQVRQKQEKHKLQAAQHWAKARSAFAAAGAFQRPPAVAATAPLNPNVTAPFVPSPVASPGGTYFVPHPGAAGARSA